MFNRWRYKKRQDEEAGRGYKARQKLYDLNKKLKKRIQEEEIECQLAEIYSLSPRLDKLRVGDNDSEDGDDEMEEVELQAGADDSMSNNVSNNAMMRQVAKEFRFDQIIWKLHWEKGILEWKRHRKSIISKQ